MKLRTKFFLWITVLLTGTVLVFGGVALLAERRALEKEIRNHQKQTVERLAQVCAESLFQNNDVVLLAYFKSLESERGFRGAAFIDAKGQTRSAHTLPGYERELKIELTAPVQYGKALAGTARLTLSKPEIDQVFVDSLRSSAVRVGTTALIALFLGFIGSLLLSRALVKPIQMVVEGMKSVSRGRLEPVAVPERHDELGWLGQELNVTIGKLKELDEMKRDFAAGITHDLKSPLGTIQGFAVMIVDGLGKKAPEELREYVLMIQNSAELLEKLIDDLLLAARLESGREQYEKSQFDLNALLTEVSKGFVPVSKQKSIPLEVQGASDLYVWGDREKMVHVCHNLLSNAFKFSAKGKVVVSLAKKGQEVVARIIDNGPGLSAPDKKKVFEKFYRAARTAKQTKGTGLGLFIVRGLVEGQGGKIWIEDNPRGGCVFTFSLPA